MKRYDNLWDEFLTLRVFMEASKKVFRGKNKKNMEALIFEDKKIENLLVLMDDLEKGTYKPGRYKEFFIYEPKKREILAPTHRDKVVQIALNNVLKKIYFPCFISDSYGAIDGKGTHRCVDKIQSNMRKAKRNMKDPQIVKLDIKKFFYTIDREILKKIFRKKIKDERMLQVLDVVTDSAWQMGENGIPLGNTVSQLSSNIYMNEFDQYAKKTLRLKYYVRYMDDIIIIVDGKNKAREVIKEARDFMETKLNLRLNEKKTRFFPLSQGVNAIGYRIYPEYRLLRKRSKTSVKKAKKAFLDDKDKNGLNRIMSCNTHLLNSNSFNFFTENVFKYLPLICLTIKNVEPKRVAEILREKGFNVIAS